MQKPGGFFHELRRRNVILACCTKIALTPLPADAPKATEPAPASFAAPAKP